MKYFAALLLFAGAGLAHADPMYVSDKLVVNVYAEANQESERLATLNSGDAVESIEQVEGYTRVRLADEREGWIRSTYLVPQPPAIVRLRELERDAAPTPTAGPSEDELKKLKDQNSALQKEVAALKQAATEAAAKVAKAAQTPAPAAAQPTQHSTPPATLGRLEGEAVPQIDPRTPWLRYLGVGGAVLLVGGALGFALGFQTLARRIRRKYGNVKIY